MGIIFIKKIMIYMKGKLNLKIVEQYACITSSKD